MADTKTELELLRRNLLDLSLRNKLINYKDSKAQTLRIINNHPREIYNILVLQENKKINFLPTNKRESEINSNSDIKLIPIVDETEEPNNYYDNCLNTPYGPEELGKRLFHIYNKANLLFEEQGYPVLYLALGFLTWAEGQNSNFVHKAPLILVPVELKRSGEGRKFTLQWTGDDIFTSITLQAKIVKFLG